MSQQAFSGWVLPPGAVGQFSQIRITSTGEIVFTPNAGSLTTPAPETWFGFDTLIAAGTTGNVLVIPTTSDNNYKLWVDANISDLGAPSTNIAQVRAAAFENVGGTVANIEADVAIFGSGFPIGWNFAIDFSGTDIRLRGTAPGGTAVSFRGIAKVLISPNDA